MGKLDDMTAEARRWQDALMGDYEAGCQMEICEETDPRKLWGIRSFFPGDNPDDHACKNFQALPHVWAVVVGVDIREYSRRDLPQQLVLTAVLHATIRKALKCLQRLWGDDGPAILVQTGDGAMVVFDCYRHQTNGREPADHTHVPRPVMEYAFAFVYALNAILEQDNRRETFQEPTPAEEPYKYPVGKMFPVYVRYSMSWGQVLLLLDLNDELNCVGDPMVTCQRILATDHGNHWLVHDRLLHAANRFGGLEMITNGEWHQRLHLTELQERRVKTGQFRYADVFGLYDDTPLLRLLGRRAAESTTYRIGSHDVTALSRP